MATRTTQTTEAEKKYVVNLFYDGDKYKDPVFVCINGRPYTVPRGKEIEVPYPVYEVLQNSERQKAYAKDYQRKMMEVKTIEM